MTIAEAYAGLTAVGVVIAVLLGLIFGRLTEIAGLLRGSTVGKDDEEAGQ